MQDRESVRESLADSNPEVNPEISASDKEIEIVERLKFECSDASTVAIDVQDYISSVNKFLDFASLLHYANMQLLKFE